MHLSFVHTRGVVQISCAFVVDALDALSGTCGLYLSTSGRW
jgi:hypothetical protein